MGEERPSILVVDDESDALLFLFDSLSAEGYFVEGSSSALDALGYLRRRFYDVVLADARLPEMDGLELLDRVKGLSPRTRVVLVGSAAEEGLRDVALRKGGEGLLIKPVRKEELLRVVGRALRARENASSGLRPASR